MSSAPGIATTLVRITLRLLFKSLIRPAMPIAWQRRIVAALVSVGPSAKGVDLRAARIGGVAVEAALPLPPRAGKRILYLHGGAYVLGSPRTHRGLAAHLAKASGIEVVVPDYRLAPEHPHPAALDDALQCYRGMLAQGVAAADIRLAGDSAGGGLAVALALRIRDEKLPMPGALLLISPWVDLALGGASATQLRRLDPVLNVAWLKQAAHLYSDRFPLEHPACSPLYAELHGLPPILIQVGSDEILLDDAQRLAARANAAGVAVTLEVFAGMWHVFQMHAGILNVADRAIQMLGDFAILPRVPADPVQSPVSPSRTAARSHTSGMHK